MKLFIALLLTVSSSAFASGKFIFMPESNYTKNESKLHMGLSVYEKITGPFSLVHYSGVSLDKEFQSKQHHMHDFNMMNALAIHLGDKLDLELGHKYLYNLHDKYSEHKGFVKVAAQIW